MCHCHAAPSSTTAGDKCQCISWPMPFQEWKVCVRDYCPMGINSIMDSGWYCLSHSSAFLDGYGVLTGLLWCPLDLIASHFWISKSEMAKCAKCPLRIWPFPLDYGHNELLLPQFDSWNGLFLPSILNKVSVVVRLLEDPASRESKFYYNILYYLLFLRSIIRSFYVLSHFIKPIVKW